MQGLCLELHQLMFQSQSVVHWCRSVLLQIPWLLVWSQSCCVHLCSSSSRKKLNCCHTSVLTSLTRKCRFLPHKQYPQCCWELLEKLQQSAKLLKAAAPCPNPWLTPAFSGVLRKVWYLLLSLLSEQQHSTSSFLAFCVFCHLSDNVGQECHQHVSFWRGFDAAKLLKLQILLETSVIRQCLTCLSSGNQGFLPVLVLLQGVANLYWIPHKTVQSQNFYECTRFFFFCKKNISPKAGVHRAVVWCLTKPLSVH